MFSNETDGMRLHTAARRYCIERYHYWTEYYAASRWNDTEARGIYPRYNVLKAILDEIERSDPYTFAGLKEAARVIVAAGRTATSAFTRAPQGAIEQAAMDDERRLFIDSVEHLSIDELRDIEPLFYRRVLSAAESAEIWSRMRQRWGISGDYWYPLDGSTRDDVEAFQAHQLNDSVGPGNLRAMLGSHSIERVWELREHGSTEYELELTALEPYYNGAEGYWCSSEMDWIIYASHEQSVTMGGAWLLTEVKRIWPDWRNHLWR